MGRWPRLHVEDGMYHIISRGNNRREIYLDEEDYCRFLQILSELKKKYPFIVHAYCLMPNHFHLLIEAKRTPLSVILQRLLTAYTKHFNKVHKRRGHVFQGRYKAIICEKDSYLMELVRYIHLNPVRAGLVEQPSKWQWSGHQAYLGSQNDEITETKELLCCLSNREANARQRYEAFIRDGMVTGHRSEYYPEETKPYIGEDLFVEDLSSMQLHLMIKKTPEMSRGKRKPLSDILQEILQGSGIREAQIVSGLRSKPVADARKSFILRALNEAHKAADVARFLNCSQCYITKVLKARHSDRK